MRKRHFTRQVGLNLPERTYNQLIEQTNKEEVTISEWIREAIHRRLKTGTIQHRPFSAFQKK